MKRTICIILSLVFVFTCLFSLTACSPKADETLTVYVPDGAPALSVALLMEKDFTLGGKKVDVKIGTGAEVKTALSGGKADIAVLPTNACAALYNGGLDIKMLSVQTWGLLYLVGNQIDDLNALKGETVCCIGQNDVPGILFRSILNYNDIEYTENLETPESDKVNIKYYGDAKNFIPLLKSKKAKFGVLGEPAASQVIGSPCVEILDFQEEWQKISGLDKKGYPQASMVITKKVYEDLDVVQDLIDALNRNNRLVLSNAEKADALLTEKGSVVATAQNLTSSIVFRSNVNSLRAKDHITEIEGFLLAMGLKKLPDKSFYII